MCVVHFQMASPAAATSRTAPPFSPVRRHQQVRNLSVHEHVSMQILHDSGVPVPKFTVATTVDEALENSKNLNCPDLVVKAQVLRYKKCGL